jgi:hypothetical protein
MSERWHVHVALEPHDLWIGVFWERDYGTRRLRIYVCLLPCLPIIFCQGGLGMSASCISGGAE